MTDDSRWKTGHYNSGTRFFSAIATKDISLEVKQANN